MSMSFQGMGYRNSADLAKAIAEAFFEPFSIKQVLEAFRDSTPREMAREAVDGWGLCVMKGYKPPRL